MSNEAAEAVRKIERNIRAKKISIDTPRNSELWAIAYNKGRHFSFLTGASSLVSPFKLTDFSQHLQKGFSLPTEGTAIRGDWKAVGDDLIRSTYRFALEHPRNFPAQDRLFNPDKPMKS